MSKAVMISIQPKWCELIANGKKTIEVRKTKPKLGTPFKVYIYCTNNGGSLHTGYGGLYYHKSNVGKNDSSCINGKVIGEFVCDRIDKYPYGVYEGEFCYHVPTVEGEKTCLDYTEAENYGNGKTLYFWHISNLVIYDKPRELGEFYRKCKKMPCEGCEHLKYQGVNSDEYDYDCEFLGGKIPITKPPQSWCYCESGVDSE